MHTRNTLHISSHFQSISSLSFSLCSQEHKQLQNLDYTVMMNHCSQRCWILCDVHVFLSCPTSFDLLIILHEVKKTTDEYFIVAICMHELQPFLHCTVLPSVEYDPTLMISFHNSSCPLFADITIWVNVSAPIEPGAQKPIYVHIPCKLSISIIHSVTHASFFNSPIHCRVSFNLLLWRSIAYAVISFLHTVRIHLQAVLTP